MEDNNNNIIVDDEGARPVLCSALKVIPSPSAALVPFSLITESGRECCFAETVLVEWK